MPTSYPQSHQNPYSWPYPMPYMYHPPGIDASYGYPKPPYVHPGYPTQPVADFHHDMKEKEKQTASSRERSREKSIEKSIKSVSSTSKKTK